MMQFCSSIVYVVRKVYRFRTRVFISMPMICCVFLFSLSIDDVQILMVDNDDDFFFHSLIGRILSFRSAN